jgi:hypothetical protein
MPACKMVVRTMTGQEAEGPTDKVPASGSAVSRRVDDVTRRWSCVV